MSVRAVPSRTSTRLRRPGQSAAGPTQAIRVSRTSTDIWGCAAVPVPSHTRTLSISKLMLVPPYSVCIPQAPPDTWFSYDASADATPDETILTSAGLLSGIDVLSRRLDEEMCWPGCIHSPTIVRLYLTVS